MKLYQKIFLFFTISLACSCGKDENLTVGDIPGLGGDTWVKGPVDAWISDNLTQPYNISVKYKWDQFELELNKTLVPPKEDRVIPVMDAVKKAWIDPYVAEAGEVFLKKYCPKYFVLVGSVSFNTDGTVTEGSAEGGRKVVIFGINTFRTRASPGYVVDDSAVVKRMFHIIHHEFGHILHQNVLYPEEFRRVSVGLYTANWFDVSSEQARQDGFITNYARNNVDDDFVEMIAVMLTEGKKGFDNIVNGITGTSANGTSAEVAKSKLRQKEALLVNYFKQVWNIDFYSLQRRSRTALEALIK